MALPDRETVQRLLDDAQLPEGIRVHSEGVARVAVAAAGLVAESGIPVDGWLVEEGLVAFERAASLPPRRSP